MIVQLFAGCILMQIQPKYPFNLRELTWINRSHFLTLYQATIRHCTGLQDMGVI